QASLDALHQLWPMRPDARALIGRTILDRDVLHVADVVAQPNYTFANTTQSVLGIRTFLGVPMLREGQPIGAIGLYRQFVKPFSDRATNFVKSFAAQAVIAIENARLLNVLRQPTDELSKALEQQTAASEVLEIISRSPTNAQPLFDAIVESAARLCDAVFSVIWLYDGDLLHYAASHNFTPDVLKELFKSYPKRPDRSVAAGRAILGGAIAHIPD